MKSLSRGLSLVTYGIYALVKTIEEEDKQYRETVAALVHSINKAILSASQIDHENQDTYEKLLNYFRNIGDLR